MGYEDMVKREFVKSFETELNNEEKNVFNFFRNSIGNEKILSLINGRQLKSTDQLTPRQKDNLYLGAVLITEKPDLTNPETVALADKIIEQLAPEAEKVS